MMVGVSSPLSETVIGKSFATQSAILTMGRFSSHLTMRGKYKNVE
jgi:hypothetical protein